AEPLARKTAHVSSRMRTIGLHRRPMDGEHVAVTGERVTLSAGPLFILRDIGVIENLHFDPAREGGTGSGHSVSPDEKSRVAGRLQVPPFELDDEVFVLLLGPHVS